MGANGLQGTSIIDLDNSAFLENIDLYDFIFTGTLNISSTEVCFYGESVNNGIIQNPYQEHSTLTIEGNITNNGLVRCHPDGWYLTIDCFGDITNSSTWENIDMNMIDNFCGRSCRDGNCHLYRQESPDF